MSSKSDSLFSTLKFKVTFWFCLVFILISGFSLFFLLNFLSSSINERAGTELKVEVVMLSDEINEGFRSYKQNLDVEDDDDDRHHEDKDYKKLLDDLNAELEEDRKKRLLENMIKKFRRLLKETSRQRGTASSFYLILDDKNEQVQAINKELVGEYKASDLLEYKKIKIKPFKGKNYRLISKDLDGGYKIIAAHSNEKNEEIISFITKSIFGILILMAFLGGALGVFLTKKAFSGIDRLKESVDIISSGDLKHKVPESDMGAEIDSLGESFNSMLEKINVLLDELNQVTNNVAHDLRTPVTRIRVIAETTLTGSKDKDEYADALGHIIEETERQTEIINTVLAIAETESGLKKPELVEVTLENELNKMLEIYEDIAEDKNIKLTKDLNSITVLADPNRLQRAISNILDNAFKYTSQGGEVNVSTDQQNGKTRIRIQDTGQGIPPTELENIFKRFFRCDESRSTPGNGLGLSLALAYIKSINGEIKVESDIGKGTIFTITL